MTGGSRDRAPAWSRWCARRPRRVVALASLLFLLVAPWSLRLPTDNAPEAYFPADHEALDRLALTRELFDAARWVRILVVSEELWTHRGLDLLREIERRAATVPGVAEVLGPVGREPVREWPPADPAAYRDRLRASPLARDLGWIDADGSAVAVALRLDPDAVVSATVPGLEAALAGATAPPGTRLHLMGLPVLEHALDRSSREIFTKFFPILGVVVVFLLLIALRSPRDVVAGLLYVVFSLGTLLGAFERLGGSLNLVLSVLPPILFVVTLATAVHVIVRLRSLRAAVAAPAAAVERALAQKGRAVFWSGVTTAIGFASLATAPVAPVRTLGITAAAGIAWATVAAFTVLPALLVLFAGTRGDGPETFETAARRLSLAVATRSARHPLPVVVAAGVLAVLALASVSGLGVASNVVEYLPDDAPLRRAVAAAEARGLPGATVELLVERREGSADLRSPAGLAALLDLARALEADEAVLSTLGPGTLLAEARALAPGLPGPAGDALRIAALAEDPVGRELLDRFVTRDGRRARIVLGVRPGGFPELDGILEGVARRGRRAAPGLVIQATGEYPLLLETQRSLLGTLGGSFLASLGAILLIFLFVLRSWRWSLVALVPNLLPVLLAFGALSASGRPLDIATVMVAAVVLGLAVDGGIHTLLASRRRGGARAVVDAVAANGPAFSLTSLLLAAGFGVCGFSDFAPTARFGGLASLAMVLVWAGALWLLPALVSLVDRDGS